jgi:hypothetical protein
MTPLWLREGLLEGTGMPVCQGCAGEKEPQLAGVPPVGFGSVFSERGLQTFIVPPLTNSIIVGPV